MHVNITSGLLFFSCTQTLREKLDANREEETLMLLGVKYETFGFHSLCKYNGKYSHTQQDKFKLSAELGNSTAQCAHLPLWLPNETSQFAVNQLLIVGQSETAAFWDRALVVKQALDFTSVENNETGIFFSDNLGGICIRSRYLISKLC